MIDNDSIAEVEEREGDTAFELRSYGRRRGRKLSPRQQRLIDELLPKVKLDLAAPPERALYAPGLDPRPAGGQPPDLPHSVWLEIGFGGGEHLVWQAAHHPEALVIGCEPFEDGVVKVLTAIEERGLANIRLHPDDARDVLRWLPEGSIERAFVLFPDPWPKARHKKRRLVNPQTFGLLARVIRPGGMLRLATDIGDYARTMLVAIQVVPEFRWTARCADDWRRRPQDWPETRYEQKAQREGRRSAYLEFERISDALVKKTEAESKPCPASV